MVKFAITVVYIFSSEKKTPLLRLNVLNYHIKIDIPFA